MLLQAALHVGGHTDVGSLAIIRYEQIKDPIRAHIPISQMPLGWQPWTCIMQIALATRFKLRSKEQGAGRIQLVKAITQNSKTPRNNTLDSRPLSPHHPGLSATPVATFRVWETELIAIEFSRAEVANSGLPR